MGYYTEFRFRAKLKDNTPPEIIYTLDQIINNYSDYWETLSGHEMPVMMAVRDRPDLPIEHPFGKCTRWFMLFHSNNCDPENIKGSTFDIKSLELSIHSEFKNYEDEIEMFIDWLTPFVDLTSLVEVWSKGETSEEKCIYKISNS